MKEVVILISNPLNLTYPASFFIQLSGIPLPLKYASVKYVRPDTQIKYKLMNPSIL